MSRTPQVPKQASKSASKQPRELNVSRIHRSLERLGVTDNNDKPLDLEDVERLLRGSLGPVLLFLSDHVIGYTQSLSVRSQLYELQNGNLPKGILNEVFPASTAFAQYKKEQAQNKTFRELEVIRPQVNQVEYQTDQLGNQLAGIKEEIQSKKGQLSALIGLYQTCVRATTTLRLHEQQLVKKRSRLEIPSLDSIVNRLPNTILQIEQDFGGAAHSSDKSVGNELFSWGELLTRSQKLSQSTTSGQAERSPPATNCVQETLMRVRSEILILSSSCSSNRPIEDEDVLNNRLEALEARGDGISREKISELARARARQRIKARMGVIQVEHKDNYTDSKIEELKAMHESFNRLLRTVQGLMVIINRLAAQLSEDVRLHIFPLSDDIKGMKGALTGAIDRGVEDISTM